MKKTPSVHRFSSELLARVAREIGCIGSRTCFDAHHAARCASLVSRAIFTGLLALSGAQAQMSVRFEDTVKEASKQYFMHWDGFEAKWHGRGLTLVKSGDMGGVPASGKFTSPAIRDTFAFKVTAVRNWDMSAADAQIAANNFSGYLASRTAENINIHAGVPMGLGVDNGNSSDVNPSVVFGSNGNRRDKIDDPGEALVIRFDLSGQLSPSAASGSFGPSEDSTFTNHGMGEYSKLMLEAVWMKKYDTASLRQNGRVDVIFYDASANQVTQRKIYVNCDSQTVGSNVLLPQEIEDGDILVLAHPTLATDAGGNPVDLTYLVSELWGFTFDIEFTPPPRPPLVVPSDPADIHQHPYSPGFSNIWRTDGELIALYRTEPGNDSIRTTVQDFHRGYLLTENRGSTVGNSRIFFDLSDVTSANPSVPIPENRTLTEVLKVPNGGNMHNAYSLVPDYRVNHPGNSYVDLSGLSNSPPSMVEVGAPPGFPHAGGGPRSAYVLPYHYSGGDIRDARTGEQIANFDGHGFGTDVNPIPVGNILLLAKIRSGERAVASYDISDPRNPVLLDVMREVDPRWRNTPAGAYEGAVYNQYLIVPQSRLGGNVSFIDYSDPGNLRMHHVINGTRGSSRYIQFQDHRMFAGTEVIDVTHLDYGITSTEHHFPGHMGEYMLPLGNLVVCAENSEQGAGNLAAIYAFQAEPDVLPPSVTYHIPAAGATEQLVTSRIGLLIHETLDTTTIDESTFKVFPVSDTTETSIAGTRVWSDKDVLTFTPLSALAPETTYRVLVEGLTDIVGNPMARYSFDFTTAGPDPLFYPTIHQARITSETIVGLPTRFSIDATPDGGQAPDTLEYLWEFGDGTATEWSNANQSVNHIYQTPGKFAVRARVRSINKPELVTMRYLQPTLSYKPAGEDGFEPRFEAENGVLTGPNGSIRSAADSSGGKYVLNAVNSGLYWDFDSVGGAFDFQFRIAMPEGVAVPGNQTFIWRIDARLSEIVNGVAINPVVLGTIETRSPQYEFKSVKGYLPREGRYRIQLTDGAGVRDPRIDYVDVKHSTTPLRYEADRLASGSITNGAITIAQAGTPWADATAGYYVQGSEGFGIKWDFNAFQAGSYGLDLRASSKSAGSSKMGLFVNGIKVQAITLTAGVFQNVQLSVNLLEGANTIELRDSEGSTEFNVDYLDILVPEWSPPPPPQRSSQIVLHGSVNRRIYTVNPDNNTVAAINADATPPVKLWERAVSKNPRGLGVDALGRIWVTCFEGDSIDIIDPDNAANDQVLLYPHGSAPHDIVFNNAGTRAFVSFFGDRKVIQFDAGSAQGTEISQVSTGPNPTALALSADGSTLLVSRYISGPDHGEVYKIGIDAGSGTMTLLSTVQLAKDTMSEEGPNSGRGVPNYLSNIAINPETGDAYVASQQVNTRLGATLNHDSTVRSIVSVIDSATNTERFAGRIDIDGSSQPSALWFAPGGDYLFVALQGSNVVKILQSGVSIGELDVGLAPQGMIFDPVSNRLYVKNFMDRSVTVHDLSDSLLLGNFTNTFETSISTVANEVLPATILQGKKIFYNAADDRMSQDNYLSCASCHQNGGHDGATWDFTLRGEGLRNTTDLRGRSGMAHGNVHWSGNFDEIQDFELDIVNEFGGDGFIADGGPNDSLGDPNAGRSVELDALAAYISSLSGDSVEKSPHRSATGLLTPEASAGKQLFDGIRVPASGTPLSCTSCHDPSNGFTDSTIGNQAGGSVTLHNVGTLKPTSGQRLGAGPGSLAGIDTPTLLGLHASAPYLHDGSAATVEQVFNQYNAAAALGQDGSAHDLSATGYNLTVTEKSQIVAYLMQLDAAPRTLTWDNGATTLNWNTADSNWTTFTWNNGDPNADPIILPDDAVFGTTGAGTVTATEAITAGSVNFTGGAYTFAASGGSLSFTTLNTTDATSVGFNGVLAGNGTITSVVGGTWAGDNSAFDGIVNHSAGQIAPNSANSLGTGTFNLSGGVLGANASFNLNSSLLINATGGIIQQASANNTLGFQGTVNFNSGGSGVSLGGVIENRQLAFRTGSTIGGDAANVTISRSTTAIESGVTINYGGSFTLQGTTNTSSHSSVLSLGNGIDLSSSGSNNEIIFGNAGNSFKMIQAAGGSTTATVGNIELQETNAGQNRLAAAGTDSILNVNGVISENGAGRTLNIQGSGTVILRNANTYTGATTVTAGTLLITNRLAIPSNGVGTSVSAGAAFGFDPSGLSDAEIETIINNVTWDPASQLVFMVNAPNTEIVSADLSGFGGSKIVLKGAGTLNLTDATLPADVIYNKPDGGTFIGVPEATPITVENITVSPGSLSGNKVTLTFTASGNVDAYASDTLVAGSWSLVASAISSSPAVVEDNVGAAKRFYVLVPTGSGNPFP